MRGRRLRRRKRRRRRRRRRRRSRRRGRRRRRRSRRRGRRGLWLTGAAPLRLKKHQINVEEFLLLRQQTAREDGRKFLLLSSA